MEMGLLMLLMKKICNYSAFCALMETESATFGEPLLHAEVVLLNRTSIVDLVAALGQLSCYSA